MKIRSTKSQGGRRSRELLGSGVLLLLLLFVLVSDRSMEFSAPGIMELDIAVVPSSKSNQAPGKLDPGWDKSGKEIYRQKVETLNKETVQTINLAHQGEVTVSTVVNGNHDFWNRIDGNSNEQLKWEAQTFAIFKKYVTPETIVIDFGTWIGPTLLYHGMFSKASYGIEADPAAYAVAEHNLFLNRHRDWANHVFLESACVSAPASVGKMTMKSYNPGESMSSITEKQYKPSRMDWEVQCYTLPSIMEHWGVDLVAQPVMIKIDVESYECKLLPSFYEWLKDQPSLPTIFVSFHPQISECTDNEWVQILKLFQLYKEVRPKKDLELMTLETFQQQRTNKRVWRRKAEVVLTGKR